MSNYIEKHIELNAPISKVWHALTDYKKFGEWFGVNLQNPFIEGKESEGNITDPACLKAARAANNGEESEENLHNLENGPLKFKISVQKIEPEHYFSYTWHPYAIDIGYDYSKEIPTLVEFKLKQIPGGTLLTVTESGFDKIPSNRREAAFRMNDGGWTEQMKRIERYVS